MGFDRLFSVLNPYNQCWGRTQLVRYGRSCSCKRGVPSIPTLTIMAITGSRVPLHGSRAEARQSDPMTVNLSGSYEARHHTWAKLLVPPDNCVGH